MRTLSSSGRRMLPQSMEVTAGSDVGSKAARVLGLIID